MKKIIAVLVILALAFAGYKLYTQKHKARGAAFIPVTAARGEIQDAVDTTGDVEPLNRVEVNPAVSGRVDKLLVEEGERVKSGQVLAYLSSTDRVAILDAARAKGEESLSKWVNTYKPTPVISPMNGTVIKRAVVEGQTVTTSSVMFALSDDLIVIAQVDESDIGRIKVGQRAIIKLDAYPKESIKGTVFQILHEGVSVSNVITYYVKIRPDRVPAHFKSEMSANIKVLINHRDNAVLLPVTALSEKEDGTRCVYKGDPLHPSMTPVKVGLEDGNNVEILSGVEEGDVVYYKSYSPQQVSASSSNPFMPSGPKKSTGSGKSSKSTFRGPPM